MRKIFIVTGLAASLVLGAPAHAQFGMKDMLKQIPGGEDVADVLEQTGVNPVDILRFERPKSDREVVASYSRNEKYAAQAAVTTAFTAVGLNCIKNVASDGKCLDNAALAAAVGGALGAAGGWIVASRQNEYETEAEALDKKLNSARLELEQARLNHEAADRIVASHKETISEYREKEELSRREQKRLEKRLTRAREDIEIFTSSKERLELEIAALETNINETRGKNSKQQFAGVLDGLRAERDHLQNQIDALDELTAQA